jgi:DNA topoisomerase-2
MAKNLVHYTWCDDELDKDAITLAFQKDRADDRKKWLNEYNADPDHEKREIISSNPSYSDFIHNELIHFSNYDNIRSIPNMLDGLKPSQRKVLFACFKRNLKKEIKVAQLSGYVSEQTSYHHGEVSLQKTIIGMAQNFVGSNNVNLLVPNGQFGTRIKGGDDAASPRYIFTHLNDITFRLFDANDFPILKYLEDDGDKIEPEKYIPILPTVLVNGTDGIGTGFRSKIPCFNPMDIYKQIRNRLEAQLAGEDFYAFEPIHPWYNKFDGTIELVDGSSGNVNDDESVASSEYGDFRKYISKGRYSIQGDNIRITELPIGSWTQDYKEFIENAILENSETDKEEKKKKKKSDESSEDSSVKTGKSVKIKAPKKKYNLPIISYDNYSTDEKVSFLIKLEKGFIQSLSDEDIMKRFKLTKILNTSSMYLYNDNGEIQHYKTPEEIMEDFYNIRLEYYQKRKDYLLQKLLRECIVLENKVKFVESVLADKIKWNIPEEELEVILAELGLNMLNLDEFDLGIDFTTRVPKDGSKVNFNYLLEMKIRSLTKEKVVSLKKEYEEKRVEYDILEKKPIAGLWIEDMDILKDILETFVVESKVKEDTDSITNLAKKTKKVKEIILEEEVVAKPKPQKVLKKVSNEVQNKVSNEEPKAPPKKKIIIKKPKSVDSFFVDSTQVSKEEVSKEEIKILPKPKKKILIKKVDSLAS